MNMVDLVGQVCSGACFLYLCALIYYSLMDSNWGRKL